MIDIYYLRNKRKNRGLTQKQLAERVGIKRENYLAIENGKVKNPGFITAIQICYVLKISPFSLYSFLTLKK